MARSWGELLGEDDAQPEPEEQRAGLFGRLRDSLGKSRRALTGELAAEADFVGGERGGDPAAVAYDAIERAQRDGRDVVIVDTAGRLHTQANLMQELAKVRRVIAGKLDGAPHETLLVVDATTGQNGLQQARLFGDAVGVTGVALTKLDGSAKGGIAVAIAYDLGLPIKLIGVGEQLDARRPCDPRDFSRALVGA